MDKYVNNIGFLEEEYDNEEDALLQHIYLSYYKLSM